MKKKWKIVIIITAVVVLCAVVSVTVFALYGKAQTEKIPSLSFMDALTYTNGKNKDAVTTVGILKDGVTTFTVYGEDGKVLPSALHTYEIGSITKTVTAALVQKAINEGRLSLSDTPDKFLDLPKGDYPALKELLTHTSGYKGYYFESPMTGNFFKGRNDFCGVTEEMTIKRLGKVKVNVNKEYGFKYSNFGFAAVGLVLESVFGTDYTPLVNAFLKDELGLKDTKISTGDGDLGKYWDWREDDVYMAAGAITSNVEDMLRYAALQLDPTYAYKKCHESLKVIDASKDSYKKMDIYMDEIGMAWVHDTHNGIIWHDGGTDDYNSYLGFNPANKTAVVVLSNLSPDYRIPATVLGVKLLKSL